MRRGKGVDDTIPLRHPDDHATAFIFFPFDDLDRNIYQLHKK